MEFSFSDNKQVDNLEKVPTDFRGLYKEIEGKYTLDSDNAGVKSAVAAIISLNESLKKARTDAKNNKVDLSPLKDFGASPAEILEAFNSKIEEISKKTGKGSEDVQRQVEKIKAELAEAHAKEVKAHSARGDALKGQLYALMVSNSAISALAEAGAIDSDLALPFLEKQVKVEEEDGKFTVYVKDNAGDIRYSGASGSPMTIKELVAEMKGQDKYKPLFKSEAPRGGGAPGSRKPLTKPTDRELTPLEKIAIGLEKGQMTRNK